MIIKHRFLLVILLCCPFVSMAVDTSAIKNASTVDEAVSAAKAELSKLNLTDEQRTAGEKELETATQVANCDITQTTEEEDFEGKYCPATGNGLKSINDKTMIGDVCSSTNIQVGEVILRKDGKTCTCVASACNSGYYFKGGACYTEGKTVDNLCPRSIHKETKENNTTQKCVAFCGKVADKAGCKYSSVVMRHSTKECICNPNVSEIDAARESMQRAVACPMQAYPETKENDTFEKCSKFCKAKAAENSCKLKQVLSQHNSKRCICNPETEDLQESNLYKEVCGKDKGKGICIDNVFTNKVVGGTQVDINTAKALSTEYARINGYGEITCSNAKPREISVYASKDYGIQCISKKTDSKGNYTYFEFVFDDVKETWSDNVRTYTVIAICDLLYKQKHHLSAYATHCLADEATCKKISATMNRIYFGAKATPQKNGQCFMSWEGEEKPSQLTPFDTNESGPDKEIRNDFGDKLDSFVFCKGAQSQLYNDDKLEKMLKQYVANQLGIKTSAVECSAGSRPYLGKECGAKGNGDDVKSCHVGDKVIEFVVDDLHESSQKKTKGALQSMGCVASGGVFNGQECMFADKKQCDTFIESSKKICPQCIPPKWNPDTNLCELPDSATVTKMEKAEKTAMIVGGVVVSVAVTVVTAGAGGVTVVGVILSSAEVAGGAIEYFAQKHIDGMAHDFFLESAKCNNASCAQKMIENNMQELANIANDLESYEIEALDWEFARLLNLLDQNSDFYKKIVANGATIEGNQKGFFDPDSWNQAQVWRAIGIGLQLASLGEAVLIKITGKAKFVAKFPKMQEALLSKVKLTRKGVSIVKPAKAADEVKDISKAASGAGREMTAAQAKKLKELDTKIAKLEAKTNRTADEAAELKKLRQERNTLLNKVGTKDADEIAKMSAAAFDKKAVEEATKEYETAKKRYDYVKKYMSEHNGNLPDGLSKQGLQQVNENMAKAEKKLKDLGQEVSTAEPLQMGKKPAVAPAETKPVDNTAKPKDTKPAEPKPAESGAKPKETSGEPKPAESETPKGTAEATPKKAAEETPKTDPKQSSKPADDAGRAPVGNPVKSKSQKIAEARQRGDLGYHGTDADIAMDDMIRSSANSSDRLGSVGYGVARDYDAAEKYAVKRLVERQNLGKNIDFYREGDVLVIESSETLNLSNKTGYVYTTAKESSVKWETLRNGYVGDFDAAQMPHSVEVLDKKAFNLDDLVRQGKVKIIEPKATKAANASSGVKVASKGAASTASKSASKAADNAADAARTANKAEDAAKGITKTVDEINVISDTKLANVASTEDQKNFDRVLKKVKDQANGNVKNKELTVENVKDGVIKKGNYTEAQMTERLNNYDEYERTHRISTQDRYKTVKTSEIGKDGKPVMKYTAERQNVHDAIIEQILDKIDDPFPATGEKPTFVMLGGRGGSGKSALNGRAYNSKNALVVDPDAIKEMLPEYKNLVQEHSKYAGLNAWEVHEESSDIAARLLEIGRERGMNVVLDATMSNAVSAEKKIIPFKQAGYRIEGAFMHTPPYEAAVNAINRGLKADGRFVPPEILLKNITNEDNFQKITPLFDNWKMYGNNFSEGGSDVFVISSSK